MKKIPLTKGEYTLVDDADYEWLNQWKWHLSHYGYADRRQHLPSSRANQKFKMIKMHRLIMDTPDGLHTDHINGNKLDNRRSNLRICTPTQNQQNSKVRSHSKTGIKGVQFAYHDKKKFYARIHVNGKEVHLGTFNDITTASEAYNAAAKKYFGEYALLNKLA